MRQIRVGVFETNSSSTHSLTIVSEEDYEKWKSGKLLFHKYNDELVPIPEGYTPKDEDSDEEIDEDSDFADLQTFDEWNDDSYLEDFTKRFETKNGDKIVAFGKYGQDG